MGKYCVKPNDSLWALAGGNSAKYVMLIECNCRHPNIKNRKRDDPYFGWLDKGECIEIPWKQDDDLACKLQEAFAALDINNGDEPVDKPCACRKCALDLQVIDLYTKDPIANASVTISPGPSTGKTDSKGRVHFKQLVDREYSIKIEATEYNTEILTKPSHCDGGEKELAIPLHQEKPCNDLFEDYKQSEGMTQAQKDPTTFGKWGEKTRTVSDNQCSEAVQDQYNFGSGDYVADPKTWIMEEAIDIGQQIRDSITRGGGMSQWYKQAAEQKNQPVNFIWEDKSANDKIRRHGFNLDPDEAKRTKAWPFGRVAATIRDGIIVVCEDGSYFAKGRLVYESDTFSWEADGGSIWHNVGIFILAGNWNAPGLGNWQHATITSAYALNDQSIKKFDPWLNGLPPGEKYVRWSNHSDSYPDGNMPVRYARDYYFCTHGTKPQQ